MNSLKLFSALALAAISVSVAVFASREADTPASFVGDPVTYLSPLGETFETQLMSDDSVEVRFSPVEGAYLKAFTAARVQSASGQKYDSLDGRFVFWSKGAEATIYTKDNDPLVSGTVTDLKHSVASGRDVIYFDPGAGVWRDPFGQCHTCTPGNGFSSDGQIEGALPVVWHDLLLVLENDLGETPPRNEVQDLFERHYSANPARYGTHVELKGETVRVIVATDHADTDFLSPTGALRAWYTVSEAERADDESQ